MTPLQLDVDIGTNPYQTQARSNTVTLSDLRRELEDLRSHITQIETLLKQLRENEVGLKKTINQYSSSISRLPPEIMADIFETCLPEITGAWRSDANRRRKTVPHATMPLVIGKVCSAWRELAWLTPKLWSGISLSLEDCTSKDCELLEQWLSRSGRSPLSIHMMFDKNGATAGDATHSILHTIANCSERWRDVYFAFPASFYKQLNSIRNRLPLLRTLSLVTRIIDVGLERNFQHFSAAPRLCHVEIYGYDRELMNIPLDQVTKLSLSVVEAGDCMEALRRFPGLSHCTFEYMYAGRNAPRFPALVSQVKYLKFVMHRAQLFSTFLESLTLPDAEEFRIDMCCGRLPHSTLISLVSRSGCSLQRLALVKSSCEAAELRALFSAIPSLAELQVYGCEISDGGILQLLDLSKNDAATVLPNLQALKLVDQDGADFSDLGSMILSRWQIQSARRDRMTRSRFSVAVMWDAIAAAGLQANVDQLAQLRQLVAEGVEISIRNGDTVII
jgi:F-box-like